MDLTKITRYQVLLLAIGCMPAVMWANSPSDAYARQDWKRLEGSWKLSKTVEKAIADQVGEDPGSSDYADPCRLIGIRIDERLGHSYTEQGIPPKPWLAQLREKGYRILLTGSIVFDGDSPDCFVLTESREGEVRLFHGFIFGGQARLFLIESTSEEKDMLLMQPDWFADDSGEPVLASAVVAPYFRVSE